MSAVACLAVWGLALSASGAEESKPAGSIQIPAWAFDRGNAKVGPNADLYADYRDTYPRDNLVTGDGGRRPWVVEYDVDFPVNAPYTLHVRYASPESRPLEVWLDDRRAVTGCGSVTGQSPPNPWRGGNVGTGPGYPLSRHGAQWEEMGTLSVTKGTHTLKLTRDGVPPNVIALRLESPVAFPEDWKPPPPEGHLGRIPPLYRRAFLPPGRVKVATLRAALRDMIATFGPRYPKGPTYLKQLAELETKQRAAEGGTPEQKQKVENALNALRRQALLSHPLLTFDKLLFVKRKAWSSSHIYSEHKDGSHEPGGNLCILSSAAPDGMVTDIVPQLSDGVFGQFDLSFDAKRIVFAYKTGKDAGYRIYEVGVDGTGLRQLTFDRDEAAMRRRYEDSCYGRYDDVDPCYLPSGKIVFASTRSKRAVACFPCSVTTLHVMDADGKNVRCLSSGQFTELDPCVMGDGRVLYMRWEYVDKGFGNVQSLWSMRPDGSYSDHVYKNTVVLPAGMVDARSIPGSPRIVTIGAPHCGPPVGPVILVDPCVTKRTAEAMTNLTPEIGYPGMFQTTRGKGLFRQPYPLSEKCFLVSHDPQLKEDDGPTGYGIYVLDAWGNRAELYRDPDTACFQPMPLRPRRRPAAIPPVARQNETESRKTATLFVQDVYRGMRGIERGRVKYVRVMEVLPTTWKDGRRAYKQKDTAGLQSAAVSYKADVGRKKVHGVAEVHDDGSACFTVPAGKNLFFQVLDEDYMELQRMRTFINLMPGESRSCVGCHEPRRQAPAVKPAMAMRYPAQSLSPQPGDSGPRMVHYPRDVQPILNERCTGCHGGEKPEGGLVLSGQLTEMWNRSYENLIDQALVSYLDGGGGCANVPAEPPMTFGSHQSKLVERIRRDPCKGDLTREEFIRIVTWIDANVPYYGTHRGKKNLKWREEPDFRPLPVAGK
ncbi:MAG: hypothetical protein R6X20_04295 [Phycisphaerae bacterium]